ncbi:MAG TPA: hypothetical protein VNO32_17115 [Candidatus Acidoferrum sp.]|jgi:hypothetical protein|nr:hypothetical protein [Candidatus Acidoferrum sp.]
MAVIAFLGMAVVCVFFLYVLVQFWLEEKHLRRRNDLPMGFPMVSSGQIVMPPEPPREKRCNNSVVQNVQGEGENRR